MQGTNTDGRMIKRVITLVIVSTPLCLGFIYAMSLAAQGGAVP